MATDADASRRVVSADEQPDTSKREPPTGSHSEDAPGVAGRDRARRLGTGRQWIVATLLIMVLSIGGLAGWLGWRSHDVTQAQHRRVAFLQAARTTALNISTLDWRHADSDVQRIIDSSAGTFHDDFAGRRQPMIDMVKAAQSTSVGTITEAALESESDDEAQALVIVSIKTSTTSAANLPPNIWRLRLTMQANGGSPKVSNVQFVQ